MWSVTTMDRVLYIVNKVCGVDVFLYVLDGFQTEGFSAGFTFFCHSLHECFLCRSIFGI